MNRAVDTLVVGAGIVGCSVAWHVKSKSGGSVHVLDRKGVGSGATSIQPGGMRTHWSSVSTRALARESREFYLDLAGHLGSDIDPGFDACGYLFLASTAGTLTMLEAEADAQIADGFVAEMLSPREVAALVEGLDNERIVGACFSPDDGYFDRPGAPVSAFEEASLKLGATYGRDEVVKLTKRGASVDVTLASGEIISAGRVVLAAGQQSAAIAQSMDVDLPLTSSPKYLFYSKSIQPNLVRPLAVFVDEHFAVKHLADGSVLASNLLLGKDGPIDIAQSRKQVTEQASQLIPLLEQVRYPVVVEGSYDVTPDSQLILGSIDDENLVWVAAGMNGRGMMLAPSVGRILAEALATNDETVIRSDLDVHRFLNGASTTTGEARVI